MAKLYFKYGAMGSSKTAQALITKFNYEERNMKVWLIKPAIDDRDGKNLVKSRIGLSSPCDAIRQEDDLYELFLTAHSDCNVISINESGEVVEGVTKEAVYVPLTIRMEADENEEF